MNAEQTRKSLVSEWKAKYDKWTFKQHQDLYSRLYATGLEEQAHFDWDAVCDVLPPGAAVCEVGGWDGQLADRVLDYDDVPIGHWRNYEVCKEAAALGPLGDLRFSIVTDKWVWDDDLSDFDTLIASHSVEHMTIQHLRKLLAATQHMAQAMIQVPINMRPGQQSTHILDITVNQLGQMLESAGWTIAERREGPSLAGLDTVFLLERR